MAQVKSARQVRSWHTWRGFTRNNEEPPLPTQEYFLKSIYNNEDEESLPCWSTKCAIPLNLSGLFFAPLWMMNVRIRHFKEFAQVYPASKSIRNGGVGIPPWFIAH
jgi:hypothetical protein